MNANTETLPQTLPAALQHLALVREQLKQEKEQLKQMEVVPDVADYLSIVAAAKQTRAAEKEAYQHVVDHALADFDGTNRQPQPEVAITESKAVTIHRHDIALLWLLCYAPEQIDITNLKKMFDAVETMGKQMALQIRRSQIQVIVDELFTKNTVLIVGEIEHLGGEKEAVVVEVAAKTSAEARKKIEKTLFDEHGATWNWVAPPTLTQSTQQLDAIVFTEPTTILKPRIQRDLTHLINRQPQPGETA